MMNTARSWFALALAITAGTLFGCGDPGDGVETAELELTTNRTLTFGPTQRLMKRDCGQKCAEYSFPIGGNLHSIQCKRWVTDCSVYGPYASLHADAAAAAYSAIFPAYDQGPDWEYWGCGPQAAQNVLNYYGVQMKILDVAQYIPTFGLIAGSNDQSIATFPDDLASGLQRLLNEKVAPGHFTVTRRSGVYATIEVDKALRAGNPIIILVNNGNHYQVVTGTGTGGVYAIDYPGNDTWRSWTSLGMDLPWYSDIFSTVSFGAGGYEDYTVITIDYQRPCGLLTRGESLAPGQFVTSCDGRFRLIMQTDGNLVLYRMVSGQQSTALWYTSTHGTGAQKAIMQTDGNFVVYDASNTARWLTWTHNNPGAHLALQNDGNLVVYQSSSALWWSGTGGH